MIRDGLTRREVLDHHDDGVRPDRPARAIPPASFASEDLEREHTTDERAAAKPPSLLSRLDARTRSVLSAAAVAAVLVNAGAVWAYWHITGSETGRANAGAVMELNLRGRSDLNKSLTPGSTGNLTVTVANDHNFPIRITSVAPAPGTIMADDEHRENGCVNHGVAVAHDSFPVEWNVARNNVAAFTVPGGLMMASASDPACAGAVFTVPVVVNGVAGVS